ncbi:hypothetical protein NDU88_006797 [Pleurodeles waltl]|uniref:Uncharacterized protein n=1 Tax=Pleurodeles waltl TaxID=8319 RepID=A0AAV7RT32_PLEWA|nr:hypothetical protein NDU88_006797 [Pleurodeles waltl]
MPLSSRQSLLERALPPGTLRASHGPLLRASDSIAERPGETQAVAIPRVSLLGPCPFTDIGDGSQSPAGQL